MEFPDALHYTQEHEWIRLEDDGSTATIGITAFAQSELGDIVFVELEEEGTHFDKDDVFGSVEAVKTVSDLFMPVDGTITARNEALDGSPQLVNEDPYGAGWLIQISLDNPADLDALLSAADYAAMVG